VVLIEAPSFAFQQAADFFVETMSKQPSKTRSKRMEESPQKTLMRLQPASKAAAALREVVAVVSHTWQSQVLIPKLQTVFCISPRNLCFHAATMK
jgi:hypothetical protein